MAAARRKRWEEHDFYDILGVPPDASQDEVKRGFRRLAIYLLLVGGCWKHLTLLSFSGGYGNPMACI